MEFMDIYCEYYYSYNIQYTYYIYINIYYSM